MFARDYLVATVALSLSLVVLSGCQSSGGSTSDASKFDDAALSAYLQSVADSVAGSSGYRVAIYQAELAQAYALPGAEIALTTGMLALLHNEAELACLFGHEIAHHELGHVRELFGEDPSPPIGESHPLANGWSAEREQAADARGLSLCAAAGYEPLCGADLLVRSARLITDQTTAELRAQTESTDPLIERARAALAIIDGEGIEGGRIEYSDFVDVHERLAELESVTAAPGPAGAATYFGRTFTTGVYINDNLAQFNGDMSRATEEWLDRECAKGVKFVPSNYWDAFGHCWAGCRASELCNRECLNPGIVREVDREFEDFIGTADHDSFWQDWFNQEVGLATESEYGDAFSCGDICGAALENRLLDLSAPQRIWKNCQSRENSETRPTGGTYSDYGSYELKIFGEPHLVTTDGLRYSFQAAGEFVALSSTVDDFVVQARFSQVGSLRASKTTAVAANVNGDRVGGYLVPGGFVVRVNGETSAPNASWVRLAAGGSIQVDADTAVVQWPDDTRLWIYGIGGVIDMWMKFPPQRQVKVVGLLGNADGDPSNEYVTRDGEPVTVPNEPGAARLEALYSVFGDSWRIGAAESLFDYEVGESTEGFQVPGFPEQDLSIDDLSEFQRREAREDCISRGVTESPWLEECIFDVGFTGDITWADSARRAADPNSLSWNEMYEVEGEIDGDVEDVVILEQFIGTAGDEHFFRFVQTMSSLGLANWEVYTPSGARLFLNCVWACGQPGPFVLPESGLYTSQLSADPGERGVLKVARNVVPEPEQFDLVSATGASLSTLGEGAGLISVPGDADIYRIEGRAGTTLTLTPVDIDGALHFGHWSLTDSSGVELFDRILPTTGGTPFRQDLVRDDTYFLRIDGGSGWPSDGDYGYGRYQITYQVTSTP
jgi:hypothetical protein